MEPIIRNLDIKTALAMLAEAIERKGSEYVYRNTNGECGPSGCVYVLGTDVITDGHDEWGNPTEAELSTDHMEPGCIIGNALVGRGVPMDMFVELRINSATSADEAIKALGEAGLIGTYNQDAIDVLCAAQESQDSKNSWGAAYLQAREIAGMYQD